jgi:hypothetical protein
VYVVVAYSQSYCHIRTDPIVQCSTSYLPLIYLTPSPSISISISMLPSPSSASILLSYTPRPPHFHLPHHYILSHQFCPFPASHLFGPFPASHLFGPFPASHLFGPLPASHLLSSRHMPHHLTLISLVPLTSSTAAACVVRMALRRVQLTFGSRSRLSDTAGATTVHTVLLLPFPPSTFLP